VYSQKWCKTYLHVRVEVKSQKLYSQQTYSDYQEFLYQKCLKLKRQGLGYRRISYKLKEQGYKTVRGCVFNNNHVQSLLNKGLVRKKRLESIKSREENGYKIVDMKLEFVEI